MTSDKLRQTLRERLDATAVPGCAIAFTRDGAGLSTFEFGVANALTKAPITPTTRLHLFSGTKLYTAAALMLLAERGLLDLREPSYPPVFAGNSWPRLGD